VPRATSPQNKPTLSGNAINIQPAKWLRLMNGPNGVLGISGCQTP
jgi:hypothetical protein